MVDKNIKKKKGRERERERGAKEHSSLLSKIGRSVRLSVSLYHPTQLCSCVFLYQAKQQGFLLKGLINYILYSVVVLGFSTGINPSIYRLFNPPITLPVFLHLSGDHLI